ncbi:hypothetical protein [Leifsonia sp. Leaf264]|uniref:hypothetical protein n=1 Tax=Leifsonia sp. Leaf264 TaxID=1736314 RepID=UPI0006FED620|nr:hypothetical protein [Leifsonia sp. Leaf264]KQO98144.1 hypothetical protein ASF30_08780 [Leifsonia sp. Leaf264]
MPEDIHGNIHNTAGTIGVDGKPAGGQFGGKPGGQTAPEVAVYGTPEPVTVQLAGTATFRGGWDLPAYPEELPEPKVDGGYDNGRWETYITVNDKMVSFWTDSQDEPCNSIQDGMTPHADRDVDEEVEERFLEWGDAIHNALEADMYGAAIASADEIVVASAVSSILKKPVVPTPVAREFDTEDRDNTDLTAGDTIIGDDGRSELKILGINVTNNGGFSPDSAFGDDYVIVETVFGPILLAAEGSSRVKTRK